MMKVILLACAIVIVIIGGFVTLSMWNPVVGVSAFITFIFSLFLLVFIKEKINAKHEKQKKELYGEEQTLRVDCPWCYPVNVGLDEETLYPELYSELDKRIKRESVWIISDGEVEIPDWVFERNDEEYLKAESAGMNYHSPFIDRYISEQLANRAVSANLKTGMEDLVQGLNRIINKRKLPVTALTSAQIIAFDNEHIKNRRRDGVTTMYNDINVAYDIIESQGCELIGLLGSWYLTIVTKDELIKLKELEATVLKQQDV